MRGGMRNVAATLDEAIEMHQMHLDDPATATPASQNAMMKLMKQARSALRQHEMSMGRHTKFSRMP